MLNLPRALLPAGSRSGEVLVLSIEPGQSSNSDTPAIDLNFGSAEDLQTLPGVGPVLAERIIAGRPDAGIDDLARVEGLGAATLARLRPLVAAGPMTGRDGHFRPGLADTLQQYAMKVAHK